MGVVCIQWIGASIPTGKSVSLITGTDPEKNLRGGGPKLKFCKMKGIHSKMYRIKKNCKGRPGEKGGGGGPDPLDPPVSPYSCINYVQIFNNIIDTTIPPSSLPPSIPPSLPSSLPP